MSEVNASSHKRKSLHPASSSHRDHITKLLSAEHLSISDHDAIARKTSKSTIHHNESWRERIAHWSYDMVDYLEAPREIVFMFMTILDRYVSTCSPLMEDEYRSAAIASLFIALRLSGALKTLTMQRLLLQIIPPGVSSKQVLSTATKILKTLSWDHPIPTPSAFVRAYLGLFQDNTLDKSQLSELMENALYLVELSVCDPQFLGVPPSKIAFAAVLLSMKRTTAPSCSKTLASSVVRVLFSVTGMASSLLDINSMCSQLQATYSQSYNHETICETPTLVAVIEDEEEDDTFSYRHRMKRTKTSHFQACT